jgi:hypothetical protein
MVAPLYKRAGRKVRAPESGVTVNGRPSKDEDQRTETSSCKDLIFTRGETTNLYAEQDQIGPDSRVARPYCECVSIGTGKVAGPPQQCGGKIDDHLAARRKIRGKTKLGLQAR